MSEQIKKIPNRIFIVPYRNRPQHKYFFSLYMSNILADDDDYEIYFAHQDDDRSFNRGSIKNAGFMAVKEKYPNDWQNINFIFNDVDTIPFIRLFNYTTTDGVFSHYYGFDFGLGGIVVCKGKDFDLINGYKSGFSWGGDDISLQKRAERANIKIDRSNFFVIGSPQILQLFDGITRIVNKKETGFTKNDTGYDGLRTMTNVKYTIDKQSTNPLDNIYVYSNDNIFYVNVKSFDTPIKYDAEEFFEYDLREPESHVVNPKRPPIHKNNVVAKTTTWTKIPYIPITQDIRQIYQQHGKVKGAEILQTMYRNKDGTHFANQPTITSSKSAKFTMGMYR